jgi:hypothetical protein
LALAVLLIRANARIVGLVRRMPRIWTSVLVALWLVGAALGMWFATRFEYRPTRGLRVVGAPVPVAYYHLEGPPGNQRWVDFISPVQPWLVAADAILFSLLCAMVLRVILLFYTLDSAKKT